jgi:rubredoxin
MAQSGYERNAGRQVMDDEFFAGVAPGTVVEDDVPRDGLRRYLLPDIGGDPNITKGRTRVTTVAGTMENGFGLTIWRRRTVIRGMGLRPDLMARAGAADPLDPGYDKLLDSIEAAAFEAGGGSTGSNLGSAQHHVFDRYFGKGEKLDTIAEYFHADILAVERELAVKGIKLLPGYNERVVYCRIYDRGGKIDAIAELDDGTFAILDWKTEKDPVEYPDGKTIQLAYYGNADGVMNYETHQYEAMPPVRRDIALVVWCRPGSGEAKVLRVPIDLGWVGARVAEDNRAWRRQKIVISEYFPGTGMAPAVVPGITPEGHAASVRALAQPGYVEPAAAIANDQALHGVQGQSFGPDWQPQGNGAGPLEQAAQQIQASGIAAQVGQIVDQVLASGQQLSLEQMQQLNTQAAAVVSGKCGTCGYVHTPEQGCPPPEWAAAQASLPQQPAVDQQPPGVPPAMVGPATCGTCGYVHTPEQGCPPLAWIQAQSVQQAPQNGQGGQLPPGVPPGTVGHGPAGQPPTYPGYENTGAAPAGAPPGAQPPAPKGAGKNTSPAEYIKELIDRSSDGIDPEAFYMEMKAELEVLSKKDQLQPMLRLIKPGIDENLLKKHRGPLAELLVGFVKEQRDMRTAHPGPSALLAQPEVQNMMAAQQQHAQQLAVVEQAQTQPTAPWGQQPPQNDFVDMTYEGVMRAISEAPSPDRLGAIYQQLVTTYGPAQWTGAILDAANQKLASFQMSPTH